MTIYLASDHAGFELKEKVKKFLVDSGYTVKDFGAHTLNPNDDYPDFIRKAALAVASDPEHSRGVVLGGSGQGEAMVANRVRGVRAAVYYSPAVAHTPSEALAKGGAKDGGTPLSIITLSREHNDANILSLGARFLTEEQAIHAVKLWLETPFSNEERHKRRIAKF